MQADASHSDRDEDLDPVGKTTSKDRMQAMRERQKLIKEKQATPQYVSYIMMKLKPTIRGQRMLADTQRILMQGWCEETEAMQKEMTTDMLDNLTRLRT